MLKEIEVDNFKALVNFKMALQNFTVIVGNNASGKSTVLQAVDFISNCINTDFIVLLEKRNWTVENIKSKLSKNNNIYFKCELELVINNTTHDVVWEIAINAIANKNIMELSKERIYYKNTSEKVLVYDTDAKYRVIKGGGKESYPKQTYTSSLLKFINTEKDESDFPVLVAIKKFFEQSDSFELLSPEKMRLSSRGDVNSIGNAGEKLPSFIKSMNSEQKKSFNDKISKITHFINDVDAKTEGRPGWTRMIINEKYKKNSILINSQYISDGMLRIMAFVAMSEIDKDSGIMLLDEIENGINMYHAEDVIKTLNEICEKTNRQIIITTHSTVFLDFVDKKSIYYLWRNDNGAVEVTHIFDSKDLIDMLEYMYPGEVLLNLSQKELFEKILSLKESQSNV